MAAADEPIHLAGGTLTANGSLLGTMHGVALEWRGRQDAINGEEYGGDVADLIYLGEEWVVACVLRNYDLDALTKFFPNVTSPNSEPVVTYPNSTVAPGDLMSGKGVELVLTPHNTSHPGFVLYNAVPLYAESRMPFNSANHFEIEMAWLGIRDGSGNVGIIGKADDIPFVPTSLGSKLAAWYNATNTTSITSDGNGVSQWNDLSGNARHLTQTTDANKPNVSSGAVNSLDAILFDNANSERMFTDSVPVTGAPFRVFVVAQRDETTGGQETMLALTDTGSGNQYFDLETNNTQPSWEAQSAGAGSAVPGSTISADTAYLFSVYEASSTDRRIELDGANEGTNTTDITPSGVDRLTVGALDSSAGWFQHWSGLICEILIIDESAGALSAAELADIETYLERWGLTIP